RRRPVLARSPRPSWSTTAAFAEHMRLCGWWSVRARCHHAAHGPEADRRLGLLDLSERISVGWTLVGGQLIHLHSVERGQAPVRPTTDLDTVLDIRGHEIGRAHVCTPVTFRSRMPSSA